jgi:hypothetical protein
MQGAYLVWFTIESHVKQRGHFSLYRISQTLFRARYWYNTAPSNNRRHNIIGMWAGWGLGDSVVAWAFILLYTPSLAEQ